MTRKESDQLTMARLLIDRYRHASPAQWVELLTQQLASRYGPDAEYRELARRMVWAARVIKR